MRSFFIGWALISLSFISCNKEISRIKSSGGNYGIDTVIYNRVDTKIYYLNCDSIGEITFDKNLVEMNIKLLSKNNIQKYKVYVKNKRTKEKLYSEALPWFNTNEFKEKQFRFNGLDTNNEKLEISGKYHVILKNNHDIEFNVKVDFTKDGEYHYILSDLSINGKSLRFAKDISKKELNQIDNRMKYLVKKFNNYIPKEEDVSDE
jgi:hypothetical protein